ncbi:hypothetical protein ABTX85_11085 [Streptomyces sp. NPDC096097]|uniref:hypothetical protein n=1 Tax=Streptomyces sp. NPDC096097 TaxID=3155546 RepID=UPI0033277F88
MDAQGFLVQFSCGPAPEHLLAHLERVDAAAAWAEDNCPTWFGDGSPPLHAFSCDGEVPTYTRNGVPGAPLRASDAPAVIADVAALVELRRPVGDAWTIYLDEGWVPAAPLP